MSLILRLCTLACAVVLATFAGAEPVVLTFDVPQTAGISGFRAMWDVPVVTAADGKTELVDKGHFGKAVSAVWSPAKRKDAPGALVFDAVHRSLLVRFPGAAAGIAAQCAKGHAVAKVELVLPYTGFELWPEGYHDPAGMSFLGDTWAKNTPRWHAQAWALRLPWNADPATGPTFNACANGTAYWHTYGAADTTRDRYPQAFGPDEVSAAHPEGRLDLTALLTDAAYGATPAERLRQFEACGVLVRKEELYDAALWQGGYEWATARGPQGIRIGTPKLVVTFAPGKTRLAAKEVTPEAVATFAADRVKTRAAKAPSATLPTAEGLTALAARLGFHQPAGMPAWQWQRVQELQRMGGGWDFPATSDAYNRWIDDMLARAPRRWGGFDASDLTETYFRYEAALPAPVRDHWKRYWEAWLMPDRAFPAFTYKDKTYQFAQGYIGGREAQAYYQETGDWRGNFSVYRTYCYAMGTMNFNHWAVAGTLMGGAILGSDRLIADGRHGLEHWPLRTWCWYDGSTQESIDHYYFSHSLAAQKAFADYGPGALDRMMGQSIMAKSVEELAGAYHPGLRRFISSSGRTGIAYVLGIQDGLQSIVHTLSPSGAFTDIDKATVTATNVTNMPVVGHDFPPGQVAKGTLNGTWAPTWMADLVDNKPLPYEMTVNYKVWGGYNATPLWRRSYMGANYGLASLDVACGNESVPVMAQWRRAAKQAASMTDLGTLIVRPGLNRTELLDSVWHDTKQRNPNGSVGTQGSTMATLQHRNKAIILASPLPQFAYSGGRPVPADVRSVQTTIGLFNFQEKPAWELFIDGQRVTQLPATAKYGQRITLKDGVSFVGLIPLPAPDLGRDTDVVISDSGVLTEMQGGGQAREALRIDAYLLKRDAPLDKAAADWTAIDRAYMGFVVEMGDAAEYADFAAFQAHIAAAKLDVAWDAAKQIANVRYASGKDLLECGYRPEYEGNWDRKVPTDQCFPYRRVNGAWPYLPDGVNRDSTCTVQGTTGRLEKLGAVLRTDAGHMGYLLADPATHSFVGINPFPDPVRLALSVPGGVSVSADGPVALTRIVVSGGAGAIDTAARDGEKGLATAFLITAPAAPTVTLNGKPVTPVKVTLGDRTLFAVPLADGWQTGLAERVGKARFAD
jgi:hypothetical protein